MVLLFACSCRLLLVVVIPALVVVRSVSSGGTTLAQCADKCTVPASGLHGQLHRHPRWSVHMQAFGCCGVCAVRVAVAPLLRGLRSLLSADSANLRCHFVKGQQGVGGLRGGCR